MAAAEPAAQAATVGGIVERVVAIVTDALVARLLVAWSEGLRLIDRSSQLGEVGIAVATGLGRTAGWRLIVVDWGGVTAHGHAWVAGPPLSAPVSGRAGSSASRRVGAAGAGDTVVPLLTGGRRQQLGLLDLGQRLLQGHRKVGPVLLDPLGEPVDLTLQVLPRRLQLGQLGLGLDE